MKDKYIIKALKKLRKTPIRREFLVSLKSDLKEYMSYHPVRGPIKAPITKPSHLIFGRIPLLKALALALIVILVFGGGGAAFASQASLPGEALYPVKTFTEDVQEALTFNLDKKVRLHTEFTKKRISEIEKLLEEKGVEARGLEVAQARLEHHTEMVARAIKKEAERGKEVSSLAALIVDDFYLRREEARKIFEAAKEKIKMQRTELHAQLVIAIEAGDKEQAEEIRSEIARLGLLKDEAEVRKNAAMQALRTQKYTLHGQLKKEKRLEVEARSKAEEIQEAKEKVFEAIEDTQEKMIEETEEVLEETGDILYESGVTPKGEQGSLQGTAQGQPEGINFEEIDAVIEEELSSELLFSEDLEGLLEDIEGLDNAGFDI